VSRHRDATEMQFKTIHMIQVTLCNKQNSTGLNSRSRSTP
jgi:hypothetical protein